MQISASRLSVLKSNPLFQNVVHYYSQKQDDAYFRAQEKLEEQAEEIAEELTDIATNASVPPNIRATVGFGVLDRLGMSKPRSAGGGGGNGGSEVVFEQMLRVIKRQSIPEEENESEELSTSLNQLQDLGPQSEDSSEPIEDASSDIIDIEPQKQPSSGTVTTPSPPSRLEQILQT